MKKALIVTTIQNTIEAFLIPHIKMLEDRGYEVWIGTNIYKDIPEQLKNNKWINISFSRNPFSKNSLKSINQMRKIIKENNFEFIHFHTPVAAFLGRYASMKEGQRNIFYTAHGFHFYKGAPLINWLLYYPMEKIAMNWTDKIITINEEDYIRAQKMKSNRTSVYKVNGVGLDLKKYENGNGEKIRRELEIKKDEFVITMVGELNKNKNQIQLLRSLKLLNKDELKRIKVIFVGIGNQKENLEKEALKNNIDVKFLGFRRDITDIIAASDLICSLSYREGLPRNIMESMTQGKTIIATNIRGNRDIIKDQKNGFLIEINNDKELIEKILILLENEINIKNIEKNNIEDIQKFSIEKILKGMEKIYE